MATRESYHLDKKPYGNHKMHSIDDQFLAHVDTKRMNWYLDSYPIDWHATDDTLLRDTWVDVQVLQSYILMGDPSLMIGGY